MDPFREEPALAEPDPLTLQNLSVGALEGVSLCIAPGEIVCLSGVSGSGKTRLLRAIADLEPHGGQVWLGGREQLEVSAHRWRGWVMMVPSESQWWADTVRDHFAGLAPGGLAALGFDDDALGWAVNRLSTGEKQRLALLRALARDPRALLLDEPTAHLDVETTLRTEGWLCGLARARRLPVLWVAHDAEQIGRVADRHYRIDGAGIEEDTCRSST